MDINLFHHFPPDAEVLARLDSIDHKQNLILKNQEKQMAAIDDLQAAVAAEDTVIDSAVTLLNGIPALIAAAGVDPAKLTALQTDIQTRTASLAAAVLVGTPTPTTTAPPVTPPAAATAAKAATTP
jgi:hypothetical protein